VQGCFGNSGPSACRTSASGASPITRDQLGPSEVQHPFFGLVTKHRLADSLDDAKAALQAA